MHSLINSIAADRVQWFRARADMERWVEEGEISEEEFRRLIRACDMMKDIWSKLADSSEKKGYAAYAREKADMYLQMGRDARGKFEGAHGTWPAEGITLAQHAQGRRPPIEFTWDK